MEEKDIKKIVREGYSKIAKGSSCCSSSTGNCCGQPGMEKEMSLVMGYSDEDIEKVPEGSNLGLGCGNPVAIASLKTGETVLDLGSGAGFDCFLAAQKVGLDGKVIGVDMTYEMLEKARDNAIKGNFSNVEFRLGEIENLPCPDNKIDVIISNCVINLSTDKDRVFMEAFRVLKPGGRLMVSDIVLTKELPDYVKNDSTAYVGCISGAILKDDYLNSIKRAGFINIKIMDEARYPFDSLEDYALSIKVYAKKSI
ncbi:MAG: arsenite methyltransferase [Actinomycetota bacterium]|nr:arsenite methyltransferase [Actinomycetota bacterium]